MPLTSTYSANPSNIELGTRTGTCPDRLVQAARAEVRRGLDWQRTADCVAGMLRGNLPHPAEILTAGLRRGDPACYRSHLLYAEPDGSFSIVAMVWLPGQQTAIHDHVAWCVTGVLQGREHEEIFAPAGDIHRVQNTGDSVAISMHVYGADISRLGTSIRREYSLPIRPS